MGNLRSQARALRGRPFRLTAARCRSSRTRRMRPAPRYTHLNSGEQRRAARRPPTPRRSASSLHKRYRAAQRSRPAGHKQPTAGCYRLKRSRALQPQQSYRSIRVFANARLPRTRGHAIRDHAFHLLADQEPHHVQFMDRTVEVQIAPRLWAAVRARRIAADQMHNVRTADIAPLDRLTGVQERPIESAIEADLEVHLRALYCMQRPVCRSEVPVDWLFTKDMLPGPRRRLYDLRVRVSR